MSRVVLDSGTRLRGDVHAEIPYFKTKPVLKDVMAAVEHIAQQRAQRG